MACTHTQAGRQAALPRHGAAGPAQPSQPPPPRRLTAAARRPTRLGCRRCRRPARRRCGAGRAHPVHAQWPPAGEQVGGWASKQVGSGQLWLGRLLADGGCARPTLRPSQRCSTGCQRARSLKLPPGHLQVQRLGVGRQAQQRRVAQALLDGQGGNEHVALRHIRHLGLAPPAGTWGQRAGARSALGTACRGQRRHEHTAARPRQGASLTQDAPVPVYLHAAGQHCAAAQLHCRACNAAQQGRLAAACTLEMGRSAGMA